MANKTDFYLSNPSGTAAVLVVGGAREVMYCDDDKIELVMSRRKGFIKLAMRHGRDLVPTFSFGENFVYDQLVRCSTGWPICSRDSLQVD